MLNEVNYKEIVELGLVFFLRESPESYLGSRRGDAPRKTVLMIIIVHRHPRRNQKTVDREEGPARPPPEDGAPLGRL